MRWPFALALFALIAPQALAQGETVAWPPANHSPSVAAVSWLPQEPGRGASVQVIARLAAGVEADAVILRVCRVQAYSCLQPITMANASAPGLHEASVPWNTAFFRRVEEVGVGLIVRHANGTDESSPVADWPDRPSALPPEADRYYFYELPPEADETPAPHAALALAALAILAWRRRR